jgi:hypothetical protein
VFVHTEVTRVTDQLSSPTWPPLLLMAVISPGYCANTQSPIIPPLEGYLDKLYGNGKEEIGAGLIALSKFRQRTRDRIRYTDRQLRIRPHIAAGGFSGTESIV